MVRGARRNEEQGRHLQALDDARVEALDGVQAVALVAAHRLDVLRAHLAGNDKFQSLLSKGVIETTLGLPNMNGRAHGL